MGILERLEIKQARKDHEQISETSRYVATTLIDSILEEHSAPYCISVGEKPKRINTDEYLERINIRVERHLARVGMEHLVQFDPEVTKEANTVTVEPGNSVGFEYQTKELSIIYTKS